MIAISINLDKKLKDIKYHNLTHGIGEKVVQVVSTLVYNDWVTLAQSSLNSRRQAYIGAIRREYPYKANPLVASIYLDSGFARMIEQGCAPFDMKVGFINSNKKHNTANGWYLTIPMRHGTPNSFQYGTPLPKDIHAIAKTLTQGQKLSLTGNLGVSSTTGYQHKNNIYDGLRKIVKSYSSTSQSQYITFRRVSSNSDPSSWIHKGFKPLGLIGQLTPKIQGYLEETTQGVIDNLLG